VATSPSEDKGATGDANGDGAAPTSPARVPHIAALAITPILEGQADVVTSTSRAATDRNTPASTPRDDQGTVTREASTAPDDETTPGCSVVVVAGGANTPAQSPALDSTPNTAEADKRLQLFPEQVQIKRRTPLLEAPKQKQPVWRQPSQPRSSRLAA